MQDVIVITENTTIPLTIDWIKKLTFHAATLPEVQKVAREALISPDPEKYIFDYSYDRIVYEPNEGDKQQLRTAFNFLRTGKGNCTTYVTLIGAALLLAGIPFKYRIVNYPERDKDTGQIIYPDEFQHIYIVTANRKYLDPVIGHKQDGTDTKWNRPAKGQYNTELPFYKKLDIPMSRLEILQGTLGTINPEFKKLISNRTKMARYGLLGCNSGCNTGCNNAQLGKGLFSKIVSYAVDKSDVGQVNRHLEEVAPEIYEQFNIDQLYSQFKSDAVKNTMKVLSAIAAIAALIPGGQAIAAGAATTSATIKAAESGKPEDIQAAINAGTNFLNTSGIEVPANLVDTFNKVGEQLQKGIITVEQIATLYPDLWKLIQGAVNQPSVPTGPTVPYGPSTGVGANVPTSQTSQQQSQQQATPEPGKFKARRDEQDQARKQMREQHDLPTLNKRELIKAFGRTKVIRKYV